MEDQNEDLKGSEASEEATGSIEGTEQDRVAKLEEELKRKEQQITELSDEKGSLESRLSEVQSRDKSAEQGESQEADPLVARAIEDALSEAQLDPKAASEKLTRLLAEDRQRSEKATIEKAIQRIQAEQNFKTEFDTHINTVWSKPDNQGLKRYEKVIAREAYIKMQSGKAWKAAIDESVEDFKKLREEDIKTIVGNQPAPSGSQGESGVGLGGGSEGNRRAVKDESLGETNEEYVRARREWQNKASESTI